MDFRDYFPLELYRGVAHVAWWRASDLDRKDPNYQMLYQKANELDNIDRKTYDDFKKKAIESFTLYLTALRDAGKLGRCPKYSGNKVDAIQEWNNFVNGKKTSYGFEWLVDGLITNTITSFFVRMDEKRYERKRAEGFDPFNHILPSHEQVEKAWNDICDVVNLGTSTVWAHHLTYETSNSTTGKRCNFIFNNWVPKIIFFDMGISDYAELAEIKKKMPNPTITVTSGDFIFTDHLRLPKFTEGTDFDPDLDYGNYDLNSSNGRDNRSVAHAKEHNMAYAQTTNTCVAVWKHPSKNLILITSRWENENEENEFGAEKLDPWICLGTFSCDVWRITGLDVDSIAKILENAGSQDGRTELADYLNEGKFIDDTGKKHVDKCYLTNVVRTNIPTGKWKVYPWGNDEDVKIPRKKFDIPANRTIWFMMERV